MFTGLVEELGKVKTIEKGAKSVRITIAAKKVLEDVKLGDSIAVNGTCLTAVDFDSTYFTADVMPETVNKTVLAHLRPGDLVNLERTLRLGDRFGGHMVSGHVDSVGKIIAKDQNDIAIIVKISVTPETSRYIIKKGSIAIDGISLTVVEATDTWFSVSLIPHTAKMTTLGYKRVGDSVNLETDIIGKYVEKLLMPKSSEPTPQKSGITMDFLAQHGF
ncbi:MAG: riboflavin synthase [Selenomonadales bacterium]|jgi:riboflavin synthase|nr:riboflavin synthase [Selenomonadales bacterium]MBQ2246850.1 riboflavin synthase [Selenomonadales bacterium]